MAGWVIFCVFSGLGACAAAWAAFGVHGPSDDAPRAPGDAIDQRRALAWIEAHGSAVLQRVIWRTGQTILVDLSTQCLAPVSVEAVDALVEQKLVTRLGDQYFPT